ncbi:hypothetical protein ABZV58_34390 [Nocardia sp. NPDC004654]|uniref:hypothetical protein n=1 Tax=Nocardia sp. NPDC004654 TaxID=3154776 RepID=UPI0033B6071D
MEDDVAAAPAEPVADSGLAPDVANYAALRTAVAAFRSPVLPELVAGGGPRATVSIGELAEAGALTVLESPPTLVASASGVSMLTAKDIRLGREPSKTGDPGTPGAVFGQPGDVVVVSGGSHAVVSVRTDAALLAPGVVVLRVKPSVIDAHFLSGVVRAAADAAGGRPIDLFAVAFPRVPIVEQQKVGAAIARLMEIETAWRVQRLAVERIVRDGLSGLTSGTLRIADDAGGAGESHGR